MEIEAGAPITREVVRARLIARLRSAQAGLRGELGQAARLLKRRSGAAALAGLLVLTGVAVATGLALFAWGRAVGRRKRPLLGR